MNIYIASDHGGYEQKNNILKELIQRNYNVVDLGPKELDVSDDYPDYALILAKEVAKETNALGILICRSGNGMAIAANKVKGAYAALCFNKQHAKKAREDDNANIICLDSDYGHSNEHIEIIETFLTTTFAGFDTRHGRRFEKIQKYEEDHLS